MNSTQTGERVVSGPLLVLLSTLNSQLSRCLAQGTLAPPGPSAPAFKTLAQIEPRTPEDPANTRQFPRSVHHQPTRVLLFPRQHRRRERQTRNPDQGPPELQFPERRFDGFPILDSWL